WLVHERHPPEQQPPRRSQRLLRRRLGPLHQGPDRRQRLVGAGQPQPGRGHQQRLLPVRPRAPWRVHPTVRRGAGPRARLSRARREEDMVRILYHTAVAVVLATPLVAGCGGGEEKAVPFKETPTGQFDQMKTQMLKNFQSKAYRKRDTG